MRMRSGKFLSKNEVEFRMYRKFGAEAIIKFETPSRCRKKRSTSSRRNRKPWPRMNTDEREHRFTFIRVHPWPGFRVRGRSPRRTRSGAAARSVSEIERLAVLILPNVKPDQEHLADLDLHAAAVIEAELHRSAALGNRLPGHW